MKTDCVIYKLTNKVNGKIYIGKTVQNFERRCQAHRYESCTALNNSINVHGWDNFDKEIICNALDEKHLAHLEEYFIKLFDCMAPKGYNIIQIDNGLNRYTTETKLKMSEQKKKYYASLDTPPVAPNKKSHVFIDGQECKICSKCNESKALSLFVKNSKRWDELHTYCKSCHNSIERKPYQKLSEEQFKASYENRQNVEKQKAIYENDPGRKAIIAKQRSKAIVATKIGTTETIEFESAKSAKQYGFDNTNIGIAIKNQIPYKGYMWSFKI